MCKKTAHSWIAAKHCQSCLYSKESTFRLRARDVHNLSVVMIQLAVVTPWRDRVDQYSCAAYTCCSSRTAAGCLAFLILFCRHNWRGRGGGLPSLLAPRVTTHVCVSIYRHAHRNAPICRRYETLPSAQSTEQQVVKVGSPNGTVHSSA